MNIIALIIASVCIVLIAFQVNLNELKLLTGKYNYKIQAAQSITFISTLLCLVPVVYFLFWALDTIVAVAVSCVVNVFVTFIAEWYLAKKAPQKALISWGIRICYSALLSLLDWKLSSLLGLNSLTSCTVPFVFMGIYLRNSTFSITHKKDLCLEYKFKRNIDADIFNHADVKAEYKAQDFKYAGMKMVETKELKTFAVNDYNIIPNSTDDQLDKLQKLIDEVGEHGGGIIYFPKGQYLFNKKGHNFIKINHSNIYLEGELDSNGKPLATIINCGATHEGKKNPWLSPFFISTGELIQESNEFFGLQFRKKKNTFSQSNSLSDPGSDGSILTPKFCTKITKASKKGETILHVEDSRNVGKYIMLGMYNTTADGNLIKDILAVNTLRPEWKTALRAGEEEAPSYQLLTEVKTIIDDNTIELARPLLRDVEMIYTPEIHNVEMLENVGIRNLIISSTWNGLFRHHGFPLYYSVSQSQQMDYGWNAINMKRVAHGLVENVIINNFTNPIYVLDSKSISIENITIQGYDGHQGIKIYQHACDCLFRNITFTNHYADMLGGEGNAYGNVFSCIFYKNPAFNPVDYDFHGFGEGPMSPPANNLFECIFGFRYIKSAGAIFNLPSCAQHNVWWNIITEGEAKNDILFYAMTYRQKKGLIRFITAVGFSIAMVQKTRKLSIGNFLKTYKDKLADIDKTGIKKEEHFKFFPNSHISGIITNSNLDALNNDLVDIKHKGELCSPISLYTGV